MMGLPTVAVLAGGLATRMRPHTEQVPKALLHVAGEPFAVHQMRLLQRYGVERVVMCIGYLGEMIRDELGDGSRFDLEIRYAQDGDTLRGTGGALKGALPLLGERFFVTYGDAYLQTDYPAIARRFGASGQHGLMVVYRNEGRWDTSNVIYQNGKVLRYDKANPTDDMHHIDYGVGMLHAAALNSYPDDTPFDLSRIYQDLIARGELAGYEAQRRFYEIGSERGLQETDAYLRAQRDSE